MPLRSNRHSTLETGVGQLLARELDHDLVVVEVEEAEVEVVGVVVEEEGEGK